MCCRKKKRRKLQMKRRNENNEKEVMRAKKSRCFRTTTIWKLVSGNKEKTHTLRNNYLHWLRQGT
jgi:hypothetical protein